MRTRQGGQSALLLLDVVEILGREGVRYAVVGAFALAVHGVVRATTDADVLLFIEPGRLAQLRIPYQQAGFGVELRFGDASDPIPGLLMLSDSHGNRVELLGGLRNVDPQVCRRTLEIEFGGQTLHIVGREDFIAMKCFAGGPQDIADAISAYQGTQAPIDVDLLRTITRRFGREAADALEQVLAG